MLLKAPYKFSQCEFHYWLTTFNYIQVPPPLDAMSVSNSPLVGRPLLLASHTSYKTPFSGGSSLSYSLSAVASRSLGLPSPRILPGTHPYCESSLSCSKPFGTTHLLLVTQRWRSPWTSVHGFCLLRAMLTGLRPQRSPFGLWLASSVVASQWFRFITGWWLHIFVAWVKY